MKHFSCFMVAVAALFITSCKSNDSITDPTPSGYVVGKKQAYMHRGRWWLGRNVLMESAPELEAAAIREIDKLLK